MVEDCAMEVLFPGESVSFGTQKVDIIRLGTGLLLVEVAAFTHTYLTSTKLP